MFRIHLKSSQAEVRIFNGFVKPFTRLCSSSYLEGEMKTLYDTFLLLRR